MEEDMGKGPNEKFKVPAQTTSKDKFVDAKSDLLSTIPRTKEGHEELDNLNNNFSERLEDLNKKTSFPEGKGETIEDEDKINKNKNVQ
ncbi:hypothetical protein RhiirC2_781160 [Rhizophagus irregularis]|uniref:Uncharacterized protein n=1 Tax=Rhizophagus irregularis TaxID=588596 RepID=A0A2N1N5Z6_9GLOM|nr:hypothetical protein RhiirC2_781160 [Rhizophagus irregularis]